MEIGPSGAPGVNALLSVKVVHKKEIEPAQHQNLIMREMIAEKRMRTNNDKIAMNIPAQVNQLDF